MARANLRGLIGNLGETETPSAPTPAAKPVLPRPADTENAGTADDAQAGSNTDHPHGRLTPSARPRRREKATLVEARYSDFQRKETRLRVDQQDALTEQARRLNRAKGPGGQRITDNTLIRLAVDLLLSQADRLAGRNEAELRRSLGIREYGA